MSCNFSEETGYALGRAIKKLILENERILVTIEPWDGGRITRIYDKASNFDHIWVNERTRHLFRNHGANYDDFSNSGIEEAFPTVQPCEYNGVMLPFFGEVWSVPWDYSILENNEDQIKIKLTCFCSIYHARLQKTISLKAVEPCLGVEYEMVNLGVEPLEYIFGVHPSVCISENTILEMPMGEYLPGYLHPENYKQLSGFKWPDFGGTDLTKAGRADDGVCINFYTGKVSGGTYSFYESVKNSGITVNFDPEFFKCLSIWLIYGGWRGLYCAMTEFFTGWPAVLDEAVRQGINRVLPPKSTERTYVEYRIFSK